MWGGGGGIFEWVAVGLVVAMQEEACTFVSNSKCAIIVQ